MLPSQFGPHQPQIAMPPPLHIDPNHHMHLQSQPLHPLQTSVGQGPHPTASTSSKRKKKPDGSGDEPYTVSEPRRLRRSHEACARCRSKKIKCDSKHPRCTACATAGTACHQEDRHRQTLTPRGHTERIELQVLQCEALLKRHFPGFEMEKLDDILNKEGIEVAAPPAPAPVPSSFQFQNSSTPYRAAPPPHMAPPPPPGQPGMYYPPPPHMMPPPGYPMIPPYGHPFPHMPMQGPPGPYGPPFPPGFQPPPGYMPLPPPPPPPGHPQASPPASSSEQPHPPPPPTLPSNPGPIIAQAGISLDAPPPPPPPPPSSRSGTSATTKGQDPNGNDMSSTEALAKNFGVSPALLDQVRESVTMIDREDLAVGSSGLTSGRDRERMESMVPRNASQWVSVTVRRNSTASSISPLESRTFSSSSTIEVWLPKDRQCAAIIVNTYFTRLNLHRPVFLRKEYEKILGDLYDGKVVAYDPGFVFSTYIIFALGTLSELNHRATKATEVSGDITESLSSMAKRLMPRDWPDHEEFFYRALSVQPDLRVTLSSLQAFILLHWYLYIERKGRSLWRLVGSMVRLAVELGLHHNPRTQVNPITHQPTFTEEECQLRIDLWGIVLIHDRGTSILLGRPLGISPNDFDTPNPQRPTNMHVSDFSEHFELSNPVAEIQADVVVSLYSPKKKTGEEMMREAARIIRRMRDFRDQLPERYHLYFDGTNDWSAEKKAQLVQQITEDEGLTLLKVGIARILLLRAVFNSKELTYSQRYRALVDAIITSHNMILIHTQLIRFPDIAFFTSPIPLHIAAMVILYGYMSKCDTLPKSVATHDVWHSLDMLPRFRWRWERRDPHPLLTELGELVMELDMKHFTPVGQPVLMCEPSSNWDEDSGGSSTQGTPTMTASYPPPTTAAVTGGAVVFGPHPRNSNNGSGGSTPTATASGHQLPDVPSGMFYPFFPEYPVPAGAGTNGNGSGSNGTAQAREYAHVLAAAAAGQDGCPPSHESFMSEERDPHYLQSAIPVWMNAARKPPRS